MAQKNLITMRLTPYEIRLLDAVRLSLGCSSRAAALVRLLMEYVKTHPEAKSLADGLDWETGSIFV